MQSHVIHTISVFYASIGAPSLMHVDENAWRRISLPVLKNLNAQYGKFYRHGLKLGSGQRVRSDNRHSKLM